tara:strand:- start:4879 stop:5853 length:975 start_codon:yes stop_codon:yes gene_type:complete
MNIREINKPANSKNLNETLAKQFGKKIDVDKFTLEQLQDTRNKVRTTLSDIETNESYSGLNQNETYAKNKLFLDVLNAAIAERADVDVDEGEMPAGLKKHMEKKNKDKDKKSKGGPKDHGRRPDSPDLDNDGDTDEPIGDAAKDAKKESKHMDEGKTIIENYFKSLIKEGEEDKAELVMAAKDMVDRLTGWMEDTAEMQSESMLELADAIRDEMGAGASESFTNTVKPALEQLYASMEQTRVSLTQGVGQLTGESDMAEPMGDAPMDASMDDMEGDMEPTIDAEADDGMAAAAPAVGGEDEAGRARRESVLRSRRLGTILSSKK